MTTISAMANRGCDAGLEMLRAEFGAILAERILEAEAADFLWDARVKERYLGQHCDVCLDLEEDETELDRIAILSVLGGRCHVAACLVDGDGNAVDLLWKRSFDRLDEAEAEFERAA